MPLDRHIGSFRRRAAALGGTISREGELQASFDGDRVGPAGRPLDTVWPAGTLQRMPFRIEGDLAGPGALDMKGGTW
jgi:glutamate carboxypeptidase